MLYLAKPQALEPGQFAIWGDVATYNDDGEYVSLVVVREACRTPDDALMSATKQYAQWDTDTTLAGNIQNEARNARDMLENILIRIDTARAFGYTDRVDEATEELEGILGRLNDLVPA